MQKNLMLPLSLVVSIALIPCCGKMGKKKSMPGPSDKVITVSTARVVSRTVPDVIDFKGIFTPSQRVILKSDFAGKIQTLSVIEGQNVATGDALIKIEDEKLPLVLDRQRAELKEAEAQLELDNKLSGTSTASTEETNNNVEEANPPEVNNPPPGGIAQLAREEGEENNNNSDNTPGPQPNLAPAPGDEGGVAPPPNLNPTALQNIGRPFRPVIPPRIVTPPRPVLANANPSTPDVGDSRISLDQAKIDRIKAETAITEKQMAGSAILAPMDGFINKISVTDGGTVKPDDVLVEILHVDPIELTLRIPQDQIARLDKSMEVKVTAQNLPGQSFDGDISFIGAELDPKDKTLEVRIRVPNPNLKIKVGMDGNAAMGLANKTHEGILIPSEALIRDGDNKYVYVIHGQVAEKRAVETGSTIEGLVEIRKGLGSNDQIVTRGTEDLKQEEEYVKVNS